MLGHPNPHAQPRRHTCTLPTPINTDAPASSFAPTRAESSTLTRPCHHVDQHALNHKAMTAGEEAPVAAAKAEHGPEAAHLRGLMEEGEAAAGAWAAQERAVEGDMLAAAVPAAEHGVCQAGAGICMYVCMYV